MTCRIFKRRITTTTFKNMFETHLNPKYCNNEYLKKISTFGFNGIFLYVNLWDFVESEILPELNNKEAEKNLRLLNQSVKRARKFGIDLFLHLNTTKFSTNHPVFKNHPEVRGAFTWDINHNCLCTSNKKVLSFFREVITNIFKKVNNLGSLILIIGGECLMHCYSRPVPRTKLNTNCPNCSRKDSIKVVAEYVNTIASAAHSVKPEAEVIVWPYSAHIWSKDIYQTDLIKSLDKEVIFMPTFEKEEVLKKDGINSYVFDYSISFIGPSKVFKKQAELVKKAGLKLYAKTESGISIEMFNVPYLPVLYRWAERYKKIADYPVEGLLECWRFHGFTGSIVEEVVSKFTTRPIPDINNLLSEIAIRDFGKNTVNNALLAWKYLSDSFEHFPFSAWVSGAPYSRGPFYIGPAHPLILELWNTQLPKDLFYRQDASAKETGEDDLILRPLFFDDTLWMQPFGYIKFRKRLKKVLDEWTKGLDGFKEVLKLADSDKKANVQKELNIIEAVYRNLLTAINLADFMYWRGKLFNTPNLGYNELLRIYEKLNSIAEQELVNAKAALELVKIDCRIGYNFYGICYTAEMISAKIKQVTHLIEVELPSYIKSYAFHVQNRVKILPDKIGEGL